ITRAQRDDKVSSAVSAEATQSAWPVFAKAVGASPWPSSSGQYTVAPLILCTCWATLLTL
ncbi:MAG: hypothetical protein ABJH99_19180, partial [Tateyamaria sp.]